MSKKIGIYLAPKNVTITTIQEGFKLREIENYKEYPISANNNNDYFKQVKSSIKKFAKEFKIKKMSMNFSVEYNPDIMSYHFLEIPKLPEKMLYGAIENELALIDGIDVSSRSIKWIDIKEVSDEYMEVLVVTMDNYYISAIEELGSLFRKVESIEPQIISLNKVFHEDGIVVDAGLDYIQIFAFSNGKPIDIIQIDNNKPLFNTKNKTYEELMTTIELMNNFNIRYSKNKQLNNFNDYTNEFSNKDFDDLSSIDINEDDKNLFENDDFTNFNFNDDNQDKDFTDIELDEEEVELKVEINEDKDDDNVESLKPKSEHNLTEEEQEIYLSEFQESMEEISNLIKNSIRDIEINHLLTVNEILFLGPLVYFNDFQEYMSEILSVSCGSLNLNNLDLLQDSVDKNDFLKNENELNIQFLTNEDDNVNKNKKNDIEKINPLEDLEDTDFNDNEDNHCIGSINELDILSEHSVIYGALTLINFDNIEELNFSLQRKISININSLLIGVLSSFIALNTGFYFINSNYKANADTVNNNMGELTSVIQEAQSQIDDNYTEMYKYQDIIDAAESITHAKVNKIWLSDILYVLSTETPKDVAIKNIEVMKGEVVITGVAKDYRNVAYLSIALEQFGEVDLVEVDSMEQSDKSLTGDKLEKSFNLILNHDSQRLKEES